MTAFWTVYLVGLVLWQVVAGFLSFASDDVDTDDVVGIAILGIVWPALVPFALVALVGLGLHYLGRRLGKAVLK